MNHRGTEITEEGNTEKTKGMLKGKMASEQMVLFFSVLSSSVISVPLWFVCWN